MSTVDPFSSTFTPIISWYDNEKTQISIDNLQTEISASQGTYIFYEDTIQIGTLDWQPKAGNNNNIFNYTPSNNLHHDIYCVHETYLTESNHLTKYGTGSTMTSKQVNLKLWFYDKTASDERYVQKESGKGLSTNDYTTAEKTKLAGIATGATKNTIDSALSTTSTNAVQNKVINTALDAKANTADLSTVATSGSYNDLNNKPTIPTVPTQVSAFTNDSGYLTASTGGVTVEQLASPDSGYTATYVVKQNGAQVGSKINIPRDFLVRSASLGTSAANNSPQAGFVAGDKYIDFIINTKDNSATDEHLYINVKDLFNEYTADGSTLTLSNGQFSVKASLITTINNKVDTAGAGLTKDGTTLKHSNAVTAQTSTALKKIKYDTEGHITGTATVTASDIPTLDTSKISDFPTNVSSFTNDSGYLTAADVEGVTPEELDAMLGLSYDDTTGILSLVINSDNS